MKRMREIPRHDRPREKLAAKGAAALSDMELVAIIIGSGTRKRGVFEIAREIQRRLANGLDAGLYEDLRKIEGVGSAKASQIAAAIELSRRYLIKDAVKISTPEDVPPLVADLPAKKQEHFVTITLNGAGEMIQKRTVTVGLLNHSLVHPREVFADAITDRAASVILIHNHPSGSLEASSQDIAITRQLVECGSLLGIRVLDHIIVSKNGHLSMKERGLL
ncbi:MAG: DNA repair protein RadC [Methanomicrobiales archaeon]|nr:DNA repair protein RadC [Methanomicrobiales archaeon]MDI6876195.1 DNA repair protein RadC [Methanomicrobiales archaeon]